MKQTVMMLAVALLMGKAATAQAQGTAYAQYTNLPTLYIETTSGADPADKTNYLPCKVTLVDGDKTTTYTLAKGGVRGRGNSTWSAKKKPWRLKFDSKVALLGKDFAKAKSWTVLANAFDKSLMRNAHVPLGPLHGPGVLSRSRGGRPGDERHLPRNVPDI